MSFSKKILDVEKVLKVNKNIRKNFWSNPSWLVNRSIKASRVPDLTSRSLFTIFQKRPFRKKFGPLSEAPMIWVLRLMRAFRPFLHFWVISGSDFTDPLIFSFPNVEFATRGDSGVDDWGTWKFSAVGIGGSRWEVSFSEPCLILWQNYNRKSPVHCISQGIDRDQLRINPMDNFNVFYLKVAIRVRLWNLPPCVNPGSSNLMN